MALSPKLRGLVVTLHLVAGLVSALVLIVLGVTGGMLVYEAKIDHWLNPGISRVVEAWAPLPLDEVARGLEQAHPGTRVSLMQFSVDDYDVAWRVSLRPLTKEGKRLNLAVDQYRGRELGATDTANQFMKKVHQFHVNLLLGPVGRTVVVTGAVFLVVLAISGLIVWWPRTIWKLSGASKRFNFDLHNALGFYSSIFMLLFGVTGMVVHWERPVLDVVNRVTGSTDDTPPAKPALKNSDAPLLSPGGAADIALKIMAGARITMINGLGDPKTPIRISMRFPEDQTPGGRTTVILDPRTGDVLTARSSRTAAPGFRVAAYWNREIHTGDIFGWPSRIFASLASLALPVLAITGPLIWWSRRRRQARRVDA